MVGAVTSPAELRAAATAEKLAEQFHDEYEALAPAYGYETREATRTPWDDLPPELKRLMVAVINTVVEPVLDTALTALEAAEQDLDEETQLRERLAGLLTRTANALKGSPPELMWHDWSDLPVVAGRLVAERDAAIQRAEVAEHESLIRAQERDANEAVADEAEARVEAAEQEVERLRAGWAPMKVEQLQAELATALDRVSQLTEALRKHYPTIAGHVVWLKQQRMDYREWGDVADDFFVALDSDSTEGK